MNLKEKLFSKKGNPPEQEIEVVTKITTSHKGKKDGQPVIKPFVGTDEQSLQDAIRGGNGKKGTFQEKKPTAGVLERPLDRYDRDRLNAMLAMDVTPEKRAKFTVTPQPHFLIMTIGDTFNEVAALGESRDLSDPEQTFWGIFSRRRDLRAPSAYPEPGDNSNALIKVQEIQSETESNTFTTYGRG